MCRRQSREVFGVGGSAAAAMPLSVRNVGGNAAVRFSAAVPHVHVHSVVLAEMCEVLELWMGVWWTRRRNEWLEWVSLDPANIIGYWRRGGDWRWCYQFGQWWRWGGVLGKWSVYGRLWQGTWWVRGVRGDRWLPWEPEAEPQP